MKLSSLPKYLLFFLIAISLFSCKKDESVELLQKAQSSMAENKPDAALNIISSIRNPQNMDEYNYMQYIVTYVGAKYEVGQDIKENILILQAQEYFNKKGNPKESVIANYYAAQFYDTNADYPKALESYMHVVSDAEKSNTSNLLAGKSLNNIGYIYYQQELYETAIVHFQSALSFYNNLENTDQRKLKTLTNIGKSYDNLSKYDSAYLYFDKALKKSIEAKNETYQSNSLQNLGVTSYYLNEYDKSIEYFQSALALNATVKEDIRKIHIGILRDYNKQHDLKSAKQYADSVTASIPEVTYKYTTKEMYAALSDYYQQSGDYKQALEYKNLESETKKQIEEEENAPALLAADKNFHLKQKDQEIIEFKSDVCWLILIVVGVLGTILVFVYLGWRTHKKDKAEIEAYTEKFDIYRGMLHSMNKGYPELEAEMKAMMEDIEKDKDKEDKDKGEFQ